MTIHLVNVFTPILNDHIYVISIQTSFIIFDLNKMNGMDIDGINSFVKTRQNYRNITQHFL